MWVCVGGGGVRMPGNFYPFKFFQGVGWVHHPAILVQPDFSGEREGGGDTSSGGLGPPSDDLQS